MQFSAPGTTRCGEALLGPRARRLEARAALAGVPPRAADREVARVWFAADGLEADELRQLAELPGARLVPAGPARSGLTLLEAPLDGLARLAERAEAAGFLLTAYRNALLPPGQARLMGVVNVTPDSFSDGGEFLDPERAIEHGLKLARAGADILDVGGESTRPGADPVGAEEECDRVLPVVAALARGANVPVSIDTTKASVAERALDAGATVINDVSAGRFDPELFPLAAERRAGLVLMHMAGTPRDMQRAPRYADVAREVTAHLRERVASAWSSGIEPARIALDPGIGFGKRLEDNLDLIRALPELRSLGLPLCLGVSRKSFLGRLGAEERPERRDVETAAAVALCALFGAEIHRVHDVAAARRALRVAEALAGPARADR